MLVTLLIRSNDCAQLRKMKAASLWTSSLPDLEVISKEQKAAKGNFPGPCPVVYYPPLSTTDSAGLEAAGMMAHFRLPIFFHGSSAH